MDMQRLVILLLVLAVVAGSARMLWFAWRRAPQTRPRSWRLVVLLALQLASAALLYRVLLPPSVATGTNTLVVATANTPVDIATRLSSRERLVALPEAPPIASAERVPDLATTLRRYGGTARLRVVGSGLTARDRESTRGIPLTFEPAPLPRGLIELSLPKRVQPGADFRIRGRAHDLRGGSAELMDPSGQRVDREPLDGDGRFILAGAARTSGLAEFRLRLHDAQGHLVDDATIPLSVITPKPTRVLVLAGGPDAELKYLRRWALDSGTKLHTQIQVGGGVQLGDAPIAFNAATLKEFDAVIVDERAWAALGDTRRRAVVDAVRNGLGLLLRVTGPISPAGRRSLTALDLRFSNGAEPSSFALPSLEGGSDFVSVRVGIGAKNASNATRIADSTMPVLTRQPMRLDTTDAHTWLQDSEGRALAAWRAVGRGRAGAWLPNDTYQLVLVGREDVHAALWSEAVGTVARAGTQATFAMPTDARQGERASFCDVRDDAFVTTPTGKATPLLVDPATGPARCAGFWAQEAGWHALRSGDANVPFHVRGSSELPGVAAREMREATERLTLTAKPATATPPTAPGPRWPWLVAWLLVSSLLWWLERSRLGRSAAP